AGQVAADGAERLAAGGEGHEERRVDAELAEQSEVLVVAGHGLDEVGRDLGHEARLAGLDHAERRVRLAAAEGPRLEAPYHRLLVGVGVDELEALHRVSVANVE